jgi:hypothetical protein
LIINCGGDYPAGVLIESPLTVAGSIQANGAEIFLDRLNKGRRRALVHNVNDQLIINCGGDYPAGVLIESPLTVAGTILCKVMPDLTPVGMASSSEKPSAVSSSILKLEPITLNLVKEILILKEKVKELEDRIKK